MNEPEFKNEFGEVHEDRVVVDRNAAGGVALLMKGFTYLLCFPLWLLWLVPGTRAFASKGFEFIGVAVSAGFVLFALYLWFLRPRSRKDRS